MSGSSDTFNQASAGPARGLGAEARVEKTLELALGVFQRNAVRIQAWGSATAASWPAGLPDTLQSDDAWLQRARQLLERHKQGQLFVNEQWAALSRARAIKVPHQRQQMIFAIAADLARTTATTFSEEMTALARDGGITAAQSGVVRQPIAPGAPIVAPSEAPKHAGGLSSLVKRFASRFDGREEAQPSAGVPPDLLAELHTEVARVRKVYDYTAERMGYVEKAVALRLRPPKPGEEVLPGAAPKVRDLVLQLTRLCDQSPPVFQRCQVALGQVTAVRRELLVIEHALKRLQILDPREARLEARLVDIAALRGKAVPLANLPRTFQADPILRQLFPATSAPPNMSDRAAEPPRK